MRFVASTIVAFALTSSTAAFAQQPPAPAAPLAPTAERTDDLSHINGQLVPVGDHNQYHYDFKKVNIAVNPLAWGIGMYGVSGSLAVHQHVVLRGDVSWFSPVDDLDDDGFFQASLTAPVYFRRAYQGVFLEPGVLYRVDNEEHETSQGTAANEKELGPIVYAGWTWLWDSGLNVTAAVGVGRDLTGNETDLNEDSSITGDAYLRFGYAF
jgi:hypothetical protein